MSFVRQGEDVDDDLVILINFDPASYESFRVGVPREGDWEVIFDSDRPEFGGSGYAGEEPYTCSSEPYPWNGQMDSIEIRCPAWQAWFLSAAVPAAISRRWSREPKKATRKRTSTVKPKDAAAKKAPAKAKATTTKAKTKAAAKPSAKATATKKPAAKRALPRPSLLLLSRLPRMRNKAVTAVITCPRGRRIHVITVLGNNSGERNV